MTGTDQCKLFQNNHPIDRKLMFVDWLQQQSILNGTGADLGCGPGLLGIILCQKFDGIVLDCFDGSDSMLALANQNTQRAKCNNKISFYKKMIQSIEGNYDFVISADTLHHMHNPLDFWSTVKRISKKFFVMDLLRPNSMEQVERIVRVLAKKQDATYKQDFANSLCAAFSLEELETQLADAGITDYKVNVYGDVCKTFYLEGTV